MSKKKCVERRRIARQIMLSKMGGYIQWCLDNVTVRDDGVERPVTVEESVEFIVHTTTNTKMSTNKIPK